MKFLVVFFLFGLPCCVAQTFTYPKFVKQGDDSTEFVPKGWKMIDTAFGDLNNDMVNDLAFIVEYNLPITEHRAYGDNTTELIKEFQKPRVLVIYFKNKQSGKYIFALQNNNFILRANEGGSMGDPLRKIEIANQNLLLSFMGGNQWRWKLDYEFKFQNKAWTLMKANSIYYHNDSGEMTEKKYDFMDRKVSHVAGNIFNRSTENIRTEETLYFSGLKTFTTFKKPWTWEITKDNFL